ncbi:MAG: HIT domain-containing protein [Candidatus Aenigmarchaeota archaeon]|nr:HIT domain-containing protein [Candidatus Aenigmarchaeota archaeon]
MPDCIFCRIASKDLSSEIVYEDSKTLAFLDINPISPGHTVVVPKTHTANIFELDVGGVADLFNAVRSVMKSIQDGLKPAGFNFGVNHGRAAGQAIDHVHVHILPRFENDGGGSMHSIVRNPPKQQTLEEIGGLIRAKAELKPVREESKVPPTPIQNAPPKEDDKESLEQKLKELEAEMAKHLKKFQGMRRP